MKKMFRNKHIIIVKVQKDNNKKRLEKFTILYLLQVNIWYSTMYFCCMFKGRQLCNMDKEVLPKGGLLLTL